MLPEGHIIFNVGRQFIAIKVRAGVVHLVAFFFLAVKVVETAGAFHFRAVKVIHEFAAELYQVRRRRNIIEVNFRIKEYLFEDSLASNPFHYNQSTLAPSSIHT